MDYLIIIVTSYLLGSIPFGLILTKLFLNKDIRNIGSGNIGATNVLRSGNKLIGYSTLLLDILKAILPVLCVKFYYPDFYQHTLPCLSSDNMRIFRALLHLKQLRPHQNLMLKIWKIMLKSRKTN